MSRGSVGLGFFIRGLGGFFFSGGGVVDFFQEFSGAHFKVIGAAIAAQEDDPRRLPGGAVNERGGLAHATERLARDHAGLDGVVSAGLGDDCRLSLIRAGFDARAGDGWFFGREHGGEQEGRGEQGSGE